MKNDKMRVFVVEDDPLVVEMIQAILEDADFVTVDVAGSFSDGLTKATHVNADIALMDVNLNGKASFAIAEILKQRKIPMVFITGLGSAVFDEEFPAAPVLQKPFRRQVLIDTLVLTRKAATEAAVPKKWLSKAQQARNAMVRSVLDDELQHLGAMPVNDQSPECLRTAAPESYQIIRNYLERRIATL